MKRILFAILLFIFSAISLGAQNVHAPKGFAGKVWNSTLALYGTIGPVTHFDCTARPISKSVDGYVLLTAGHCVQEIPAGVKFSVAEEIGGARTPVKLIKVYEGTGDNTVDIALFDLKTTKQYAVLGLGTDEDIRVGDPTINVHFAMGVGKQLSYGKISSRTIVKSEDCQENGCLGNFFVQEAAGSGASGSAIISARTHRVIGILVYQTEAPIGFATEPISALQKFTALANQPHPGAKASVPDEPALRIPEVDYQNLFGETHPFTLTVPGPNPRFEQSGYTFVVDILGNELSDEYYYDVPVFIREDEDGTFRLVSTKEGFSVPVVVVKGPEAK